jgi:sigma-B regulation protein RsbU (phosphoserine phosphatase)
VLDALEEGICLLDREGRITGTNAAALELLQCVAGDLTGQPLVTKLSSSVLTGSMDWLGQTGRTIGGQGTFCGAPVAFALIGLDIADGQSDCALLRFRREQASPECELAQRDSEVKLEVVLDTIVDAVIVADETGHIQLVNAAAEEFFGYGGVELKGKNINMLMPSPDKEAHDGYLRHFLATGEKKIIGIGREVIAQRKNGELVPVYLSVGDASLNGRRLFVGVLHDLTKRRINEARLTMLSDAMEQSPAAVMIADLEGTLEYVNARFTALTGYTSQEAIGRPLSLVLINHGSAISLKDELERVLREQGKQEEVQGRRKNGEVYWALQSISPLNDRNGHATHFFAAQLDITDEKRAKQALLESEARFQQVAEMAGEWLWEQNVAGCYIYSSEAVFGILGYRPDEILGKSYLDLMTEEDHRLWGRQTAQIVGPKRFHKLINHYRHKDGHEVYTESTGAPVFGPDGTLLKWQGVDSDITARKRYEDALRLRDRAIEAASVGIDITDARLASNPNIYVNRALSRLTGYPKEELIGRSMSILQGPDTDPESIRKITDAVREGRSCEVIIKNYRKDGTPFWNDLLISPVHDDSGNLTHYIGVQSDVTELRRAEQERHELEIAKQIQLSLLPKGPIQTEGVRVAGACLPATHVGGDYYDYFLSGHTLDVVIADVSGHSVGAALIMAEARSALKAETRLSSTGRIGHGVAGLLHTLNEVLHDDLSGADLFISMFYLRYQPGHRRLFYANAGHNCPLLLSGQAKQCQQLDAEGMIFGVKPKVKFSEESITLSAGDRILLYTDGATEAQNKAGEFYGVSRLCWLLTETRDETPEQVIDIILEDLRAFCGEPFFNDDVSLVVMDVTS